MARLGASLLAYTAALVALWFILCVRLSLRPRQAARASFAVWGLGTAALATLGARTRFLPWWPAAEVGLAVFLSAASTAFLFYRDPERRIPEGVDTVVSPADGTVRYVRTAEHDAVPVATKGKASIPLTEFLRFEGFRGKDAVLIGIEMNVLNVHVNRAPASGRIVFQHRVHGRFLSLRTPESLVQNERLVHVIDADGMHIGVVQIASRLVRRIVAYLREGDRVEKGQRIGMIRFGSQVDLILPGRYGFQLCVQPGQAVFAGETVIARIPVCREEC